VRSQVAGEHPNYLQHAKRRLEKAGVRAEAIDRFLTGERNGPDLLKGWRADDEGLETLSHFLEAWQVFSSRGRVPVLGDDDAAEVEIARGKMYLQEICRKYGKMVERGTELEALSFEDPQLEEASRCYLYGFYRAAIVLSASAVESRLKVITGQVWLDNYPELFKGAASRGALNPESADWALHVFRQRNKIAHDAWKPQYDDAKEILGIARKIVRELQSRGQ
jgi:hypothetical protein